ncbi:MAG: hypothetical protein RJA98_1726 [Pseudomonadota bacterium]|jgi:DNA-binding IclR family transcriptional regulator
MKEYRLLGWPELPAPYNKTPHRRMLSDMSHRHMSTQQLALSSGLRRSEVRKFIAMLSARHLLEQREATTPGPLASSFQPLRNWLRRCLAAASRP